MKLLIDTHVLLWFLTGDARIGRRAIKAIEDPETQRFISIASYWEMAIKASLGKLKLTDSLDAFIQCRIEEGFQTLPVSHRHVSGVISLPFHHHDPFDRLLISQALHEGMAVCTADAHFAAYGLMVIF